jgi:hypothetical protein
MYQIKSASLPTVDDVWARRAVLSLIMADVMTRRAAVRPTNIKSLAKCEFACISLNVLHPPIVYATKCFMGSYSSVSSGLYQNPNWDGVSEYNEDS